MRKIPNYSLYGESARPPWYDAFNFEWIVERSAPNDWHIDAHRHDALLQFLYIRGGGGQVLIENSMIEIVPPCVIVLPAQTVHGFNFAPNVDGLVVTVAQRSIETLASIAAPGLIPVLQRADVSRVNAQAVKDGAFMTILDLLEKEFRASNRGHMAAGMSLLIALFVHVWVKAHRRAMLHRQKGGRSTSSVSGNSWPHIFASIGRSNSMPANSA